MIPDLDYLFLLGLSLGDGVSVRDGQLYLDVDGAGPQPVPVESLDRLEERGWIDCGHEPPKATEKGEYWLSRWMKTRLGKGRIVRV